MKVAIKSSLSDSNLANKKVLLFFCAASVVSNTTAFSITIYNSVAFLLPYVTVLRILLLLSQITETEKT